MSTQFRKRVQFQKQINGNQNYLNFIKKNHQLIQDEFSMSSNTRNGNQSERHPSNHNSCTFNFKVQDKIQKESSSKTDHGKHAIHDSLSKFQLGSNHLNQISDIYKMGENTISYDQNHQTIYQNSLKKNQEGGGNNRDHKANQIQKKYEAAKHILSHLNKSRSPQTKKVELTKLTINRYQSIQQQSLVEMNFKFPIIEKKNVNTIDINKNNNRSAFQNQLKERLRMIEKRQKASSQNQKNYDNKTKAATIDDSRESRKDKLTFDQKVKIREELYDLLPAFRSPNVIIEQRKNRQLIHNKNKSKKDGNDQLQKFVDQYLQQNVKMKNLVFVNDNSKQKSIIFNSQQMLGSEQMMLNSMELQNKQQFDLLEPPHSESQKKMTEFQTQNSQVIQQKQKVKKPAVTELRYEGDLSIYDLKIRYYRQFLFMVNLAHRVFDPILLKDSNSFKPENRYKFYLGKGNNYLLIKSLLKRRFWWTVQQDPKKANFVWTQLKLNYFYQLERKAQPHMKNHKLDVDFELPESPKRKKKNKKDAQKQLPAKVCLFKAPLPVNDLKIFTITDKKYYDQFLEKAQNPEKLLKFTNRLKYFDQSFFKMRNQDPMNQKVHNHLQYNYFIGNKKALFYNLKQYYDLQNKNVFQIIPLTYHLKHGASGYQYQIFSREFKRLAKQKINKTGIKNIWIVKPGELSNRGQGITVIDEIYELNNILKKKQKHFNGKGKTYIVQKYIQKPLLYKGRKFDIRHYMMISRLHGVMRAYWFSEGYIRTSSYEYDINQIGDEIIHLTNDAIQKYCDGYGKYEQGNKLSYNQFQRYMDSNCPESKFNFAEMIYPKMKSIALDAVKATYLQLDPNNSEHNFEVFGLDFMIDVNYNVLLIEVNTNPCLELSSKLLARIIPTMVEHTFRLTLDVLFPPPSNYPNSQKYLAPDNPLERLQFQLIFDEDRDGKQITQLYQNAKIVDMGEVDEQDQTYENDGKQIELDNQIQ